MTQGSDSNPGLPTFAAVQGAAARLDGVARRTPVLTSSQADRRAGATLLFKMESFQRSGSFKFRGAYNAISRLPPDARPAGVVAFSSGNHGQAVALASQMLGLGATVLMPSDAPAAKVASVRGYGGEVIVYDRHREDRNALAAELIRGRGATLIPPFDAPDIIAGQGTAALELVQDVGELDELYVPLGGGGLTAGAALVTSKLHPRCKVFGVEPEAGDDGRQSFRRGAIQAVAPPQTLADGARTQQVGQLTFAILKSRVHDVLTVSDDELRAQMTFFAERMKVVVEPTGCLGAAAALRRAGAGRRVGVIVSGGNLDVALSPSRNAQHLARLEICG